MRGRRELGAGRSTQVRWTAGAVGLAVSGAALAVALLPAGSAGAAAAKTPTANYHAGSDKAVFTATGIEDSNCLVSVGGSTVYIKPGDRIDFSSGLAGLSLGGLDLQGGQIAGLDVHATIDGGANRGGQTLSVPAGKTVKVTNLSAGTHTLAWSASSVSVAVPAVTQTVTGLLGAVLKTIPAHSLTLPLSSNQLKSGAKLAWSGKIFVTKNAARCTLSVQTPKTTISGGPLKITVPGQKVTVPGATVPTSLPSIPKLTQPSSTPSSSAPTKPSAAPSYTYSPPVVSVPEMVVPKGNNADVYGGGSGYDLRLGTDNGTSQQLSNGGSVKSPAAGKTGGTSSVAVPGAARSGKSRTVDLASNQSDNSIAGQLPVLLAIIAVIALAIVAGTYARLYLLGRRK